MGIERADDAGVYRLTDECALVQTIDFFTPIVDDPYRFGQIAAANALSDVYAMGGRPICAMNIVCFPNGTMEIAVLHEVLRGGLDKVHEAGACLVGGHSIADTELKYGLSVSGTVHPDRVWTNGAGQPGDRLVLTKALGTGIVATAVKRGKSSSSAASSAEASMMTLNRLAAEALIDGGFEVHACTDVTGFGLLGHGCEMVGEELGMRLEPAAVPLLPEADVYAQQGLCPGGLKRNRDFRAPRVDTAPEVAPWLVDLLFDPQTSGGLLVALPADQADRAVEALGQAGVAVAAVVGELTEEHPGRIQLV